MTTRLNPYISFRNNAREALEFYQSVLGGELTISTFGEFGIIADQAEADLVMHGMLVSSNDLVIMAADTPSTMEYTPGTSMSVSVSGEDVAELTGYWEKVSVGATAVMPFEVAPWGDRFGMCTDKFGVTWMVNAAAAAE